MTNEDSIFLIVAFKAFAEGGRLIMRMKPIIAVAFAAALLASTSAGAGTIALYNTGVDNSGTVLPNGTTPDLHYSLTAPSGTNVTLVRTSATGFPIPPYLPDDSLSAWIGPNSGNELNGPGGLYDYQTTFSLADFNASTASIFGQWSSDNAGIAILLNGVDIVTLGNPYGPPFSYEHWVSFAITGGFLGGLNTLDFIVQNGNGEDDTFGPTALRVEMTGTATATPLPAALPLFATGLGALGLLGWRRKRKTAAIAA